MSALDCYQDYHCNGKTWESEDDQKEFKTLYQKKLTIVREASGGDGGDAALKAAWDEAERGDGNLSPLRVQVYLGIRPPHHEQLQDPVWRLHRLPCQSLHQEQH